VLNRSSSPASRATQISSTDWARAAALRRRVARHSTNIPRALSPEVTIGATSGAVRARRACVPTASVASVLLAVGTWEVTVPVSLAQGPAVGTCRRAGVREVADEAMAAFTVSITVAHVTTIYIDRTSPWSGSLKSENIIGKVLAGPVVLLSGGVANEGNRKLCNGGDGPRHCKNCTAPVR